MATYHLSIKSGKKGKAVTHSDYIARKRSHKTKEDLVLHKVGNLPAWAGNDIRYFWEMADKFERTNGAAYREYELALPRELEAKQQEELVDEFISHHLKGKTFEVAIHCPAAAIEGQPQAHSHIMFSDRIDDGLERLPSQHFARFNASHPNQGGCRKDSGGKDKKMMRDQALHIRQSWEHLQNSILQRHGHNVRVDCRSHHDRQLAQEPERHLGAGQVRRMTREELASIQATRINNR